jgi:hypothetical protein
MRARSIRSRNLKLLILGAFSAVGCWALFFSATPINALADTTAAKKDEIIGKIAGYKTWQQVNKEPEKPIDAIIASTVFTVTDSSAYG